MKERQTVTETTPRMMIRVEYVGVIAVACLAIGAIIGGSFMGNARPNLTQRDVQAGMSGMISQIGQIDDVEQLVQLGNQAYDAHNPQVAIPAYEKALRLRPDDSDVLTDLGVMYREMGDYQQAVDRFRKAMAVDADHAFSRFNLGIVLMHDVKDYAGAREVLEEFLRISPTGREAEEAKKNVEELKKLEQ